ncbi:MAG: DUF4886 domain-containing protein [Planctomycetota bacterium]
MAKLLTLLLAAACAPGALAQSLDVLFLGNSYTARNDLPALFEGLCAAGGHAVSTDRNTPGGNSLGAPQSTGQNHASNPGSLGLIASRSWDIVVLQEQSTIPTIPFGLANWMTPGAQALRSAALVSNPDVRVVLYETWGRRDGGQFTWAGQTSPFFPDFGAMQDALTAGYVTCGDAVGAEIAPVGRAWRRTRQTFPSIELFNADGSHPSPAGSYLAACVLYARILGESPSGLGFTGALSTSDANVLQDLATLTVFGSIGTRYCVPAVPNSTLSAGRMDALGSVRVLDRSVRLRATLLPPSAFGFFLTSRTQGLVPMAGGSAGNLCLGGDIGRYVGPGQILDSGSGGRFELDLALEATPTPTGLVSITAGEAWSFQAWHRDSVGGQATSNFTDAVRVAFE